MRNTKKQQANELLKEILSGIALMLKGKEKSHCLDDESITTLSELDNGSPIKSQMWEHIAQCEKCYLKWRDSSAAQNNILFPFDDICDDANLQSTLYTALINTVQKKDANCIDDNILAELVDGRLDQSMIKQVQQHLASCEDCYEHWRNIAQSYTDNQENFLAMENSVANAEKELEKKTNVPQKTAEVSFIRDWLRKKSKPTVMFTSGSFATAALLLLAIVFSPSQHYTFNDELAMIINETSGFAQPVLLTIKSTPGTRTERTSNVTTHLDLAFNAGIQRTFASFLTAPNPQWEESLESMKDVLPPCLLKTGGLDHCSPAIKTSYAAGQWATAVFSICAAGKIENYSSSLSVILNDLTATLEAYSVDAKFVESFSAANKRGDQSHGYCTLANRWIN